MICNTVGQTPEQIEQVNIGINGEPKVLIREDLTEVDKIIYDEYVNIFMVNLTTCIDNFSDFIEGARFTNLPVIEDTISFDYNTITDEDKTIVDDFITLLKAV